VECTKEGERWEEGMEYGVGSREMLRTAGDENDGLVGGRHVDVSSFGYGLCHLKLMFSFVLM